MVTTKNEKERKKIDRTNEKTPVRCRVDQSTNQLFCVFREEKKRERERKKKEKSILSSSNVWRRERMRERQREKKKDSLTEEASDGGKSEFHLH